MFNHYSPYCDTCKSTFKANERHFSTPSHIRNYEKEMIELKKIKQPVIKTKKRLLKFQKFQSLQNELIYT